MSTHRSLERWWRTLQHHQCRQLMWRLYYRISHRLAEMFPIVARWRLNVPCQRFVPELFTEPTFWPEIEPIDHSISIAVDPHTYVFTFLHKTLVLPKDFSFDDSRIIQQSHLWIFHLHYMEYLHELADEECFALMQHWIIKNPPYVPSYWKYSWSPYTTSVRIWNWIQIYIQRAKGQEKALQHVLLRSLYQQLIFLSQHIEYDLGGNHLIKNLKALIAGSQFFGEHADLFKQKEYWIQTLFETLKTQILPDGMHFERSASYHQQVLIDLLDIEPFLSESQQQKLLPLLQSMAQVWINLIHPDQTPCAFNDIHRSSPDMTSGVLKRWQAFCQKRSIPSELIQHPHIVLPYAGYYGHRSAQHYLIGDAGIIGPHELPAHGHGDIFSFEWSIEGERILVDTGTFAYQHPRYRPLSRSTAAHNTLTLEQYDQAEFWSDFRVGRLPQVRVLDYQRTADGFCLEAEHTGYAHLAGRPIHRRQIVWNQPQLTVTDIVNGGEGQRVFSRLHLRQDWTVRRTSTGLDILLPHGVLSLQTQASITVRSALNFPELGRMNIGWVLILDYGTAPTQHYYSLLYLQFRQ